ncbi:MAG TPA: hypothetical protein DCY59_03660 [Micrococcaceae bacterium]|nr:hypothetical protein [Micrococcaceae bacterium]
MPELDINASANEVVALLQQGQAREAAARLDTLRQEQSTVVQEALDRYVAVRADAQLAILRQPDRVPAADAATLHPMLDRMKSATWQPRLPLPEETRELSQAQQHDVYASIVSVRGNDAARGALATEDRVILGLRNESRTIDGQNRDLTLNQNGTGVYNDRIVVLWTDPNGSRRAHEFNTATTEPTAQYDHHAGSDGNRIYADSGRQAPRLDRAAGYHNVTRRKIEGDDVNGDGVRDLGRLAESTTELLGTTHPRNRQQHEFSLRPTPEAVANGTNRVERDTNGDGWFDARDTRGVQGLNNTFKIHRGSGGNTDSAGCQTIGDNKYDDFIDTVRGTPGQSRWQYVLTSTSQAQPPHRWVSPDIQLNPVNDPRQPQHADHALFRKIDIHVRELGGRYIENSDAYSLALLYEAKARNATTVDRILPSNATGSRTEGETIFLVQGNHGDPVAQRIAVSSASLAETSITTSLQRLQELNTHSLAPNNVIEQQEAPTIGGR